VGEKVNFLNICMNITDLNLIQCGQQEMS